MKYPADVNPFADPRAGKRGRRPYDQFKKSDDEFFNQRYIGRAFHVPLDLIDKAINDAGLWGYKLSHTLDLQNGLILMVFTKQKK